LKVAALFSGDASSICSIQLIQKAGLEVRYLVTARAPQSSRMYTSLDLDLTSISAQNLAIPLIEFVVDEEDEISPLIKALASLDIDGLCDGAVASNYRRNRLVRICQKLDIQLVLPLWHKDPAEILANMIEEGFETMIVRFRSDRLDGSWLGRVLAQNNLDEFLRACDENRISPLGESGEFETFVVAGPNMRGRVELEFEKRRSENLGWLEITGSKHVNG
jgi:diphthine-ammonia ligase